MTLTDYYTYIQTIHQILLEICVQCIWKFGQFNQFNSILFALNEIKLISVEEVMFISIAKKACAIHTLIMQHYELELMG